MKYICYIFLLLITSELLNAQEKLWTLDECISYAIQNSPSTNKQIAQNKIYHQNYLNAIGGLLPSLNASTNARFDFGRAVDPETNTYIDRNSFSNGYSLSSSMTLFDGLANINRIKIQKYSKILGREQLQQSKDNLALNTMDAFIRVVYYKELVKLAEYKMEESYRNLRRIQRMEELGMSSVPDVAEIQAQYAADSYTFTQQNNALKIYIIHLKEKMNFPIDEDLNIEPFLPEEDIQITMETPLNIYNGALNYHPVARSADINLLVQKLNLKNAKASFIPTISVNAGIGSSFSRYMDGSYTYIPFGDQLKNKRTHYVNFTLSIPLFNGFSKTTSYNRAKQQMIISSFERDESLRALYADIDQAVTDMNGYVDEFTKAQNALSAMELAYKVNKRKYEQGLINAIELNTSSNRFFESQVNELNTRMMYFMKKKLVSYYKGESFYNE